MMPDNSGGGKHVLLARLVNALPVLNRPQAVAQSQGFQWQHKHRSDNATLPQQQLLQGTQGPNTCPAGNS